MGDGQTMEVAPEQATVSRVDAWCALRLAGQVLNLTRKLTGMMHPPFFRPSEVVPVAPSPSWPHDAPGSTHSCSVASTPDGKPHSKAVGPCASATWPSGGPDLGPRSASCRACRPPSPRQTTSHRLANEALVLVPSIAQHHVVRYADKGRRAKPGPAVSSRAVAAIARCKPLMLLGWCDLGAVEEFYETAS